ncbi:CapA family protein [Bdellovibrio reynosensis]|uniref:CapA family protein n=1 Tax=Bdellovibrio reynosensis TaxID=2835041 RepID=A0ABY4C9Z9_9BACT|nr:CapA family protein [Bdellovibrio reynosensis]UOF01304.1 CapA family protein [Bdellovibrio reynosensis]
MKTFLASITLVFSVTAFSQEYYGDPIIRSTVPGALDISYSTACDSRNQIATISFVGDILVHKMLYEAVARETKNFAQIWRKSDSLIQKADFSVGNLEGPAALGIDMDGKDRGDIGFVYDGEVYSGTNFKFNYHPRILFDLKNSGYDLLTVANNHTLDRYAIGVDRTHEAARKINLPIVGTRMAHERNAPFHQVVTVKNMKIAFLGCTEMTNGKEDKKDQVLFCYKNPDRILTIIKELAQNPKIDAIIVLPHWGSEYTHNPDNSQKNFAKKYLEAGATAVVGSHPHVLQPWQKYVTSDGRETFIIYSLGNFVAGQAGLPRKTGTVAYMGLSKEGYQKAKIVGVAYTPTYRDGTVVYPIGSTNSKEILAHTAKMFGTKYRVEPAGSLPQVLCAK